MRRSATARRLAVCVAATLALAAPASAQAALPDDFWGLNAQEFIRNNAPETWAPWFDTLQGLGIPVARTDFFHEDYETTTAGVYNWTRADQQFFELAKRGIRIRAVLVDRSPHPSSADQPYIDFAGAFAARYGDNHSPNNFWDAHPELPRLPVRQIEIYNEPNTSRWWHGTPSASGYWNLFAPSRTAIKAASPDIAVLFGGLAWNDVANYVRGIWDASGHNWALEGIGFHPWGDTANAVFANVRNLTQTLRSIGQGDVPLWLTEIGWVYNQSGQQPSNFAHSGPLRDSDRSGSQSMS